MINKYFSGKKPIDEFIGNKVNSFISGRITRYFSGGRAIGSLPVVTAGLFSYPVACNGFVKVANITDTRSFVLGGANSGGLATIEKLTHVTELTAMITAVLHAAGYNMGAMNSATKGYAAGGTQMNAKQDCLTYLTEVASSVSVNIGNRNTLVGASRDIDGWYAGGNFGTNVNTIDAITFATDVKLTVTATLGIARQQIIAHNSPTKAYWVGGYTTVPVAVIDGTTFATKLNALLSATLSVAKDQTAGINSLTKGYSVNGDIAASPYTSKTIDAMTYATDTLAVLGTQSAYSRSYNVGTNNGTSGYISGGMSNGNIHEKFMFSGETISALAATMKAMRYSGAGHQSGGFY